MSDQEQDYRSQPMPSEGDSNFDWEIRRAPATEPMKLISLSSVFYGIRTHFWKGRTTGCRNNSCEACADNRLSRWNGYLLAIDMRDNMAIVFEFTPPGAKALKSAEKEFGTMRGLQIVAHRPNKRPNGKVHLRVNGMDKKAHALQAEQDIWPVLSLIWGLKPEANMKEQGHQLDDLSEHEKVLLRAQEPNMARGASTYFDTPDSTNIGQPNRLRELNGKH